MPATMMFLANLAQLDSYRVRIETKIKEIARKAKILNLLLKKSIPHKETTINFVYNEKNISCIVSPEQRSQVSNPVL